MERPERGLKSAQRKHKKNLVTSELSWFKVQRTTSMNQKFPYILRISQKAKHVRFQVSVEKGLEIIVPRRFEMFLMRLKSAEPGATVDNFVKILAESVLRACRAEIQDDK